MFTAVNDGGTFSAEGGECPYCLCDNKWHSVQAELIRNVLTLQVDDGQKQVGVSPGYDVKMNTNTALYIAGFPGINKELSLSFNLNYILFIMKFTFNKCRFTY